MNRKIVLNNDDYDLLSREIEGIEHITSRFYFNYRSMQISHGDRLGPSISGHPIPTINLSR